MPQEAVTISNCWAGFRMCRLEDLLGSLCTLTFLPAHLQKSYFKDPQQPPDQFLIPDALPCCSFWLKSKTEQEM